jgi:hypothetical protein
MAGRGNAVLHGVNSNIILYESVADGEMKVTDVKGEFRATEIL